MKWSICDIIVRINIKIKQTFAWILALTKYKKSNKIINNSGFSSDITKEMTPFARNITFSEYSLEYALSDSEVTLIYFDKAWPPDVTSAILGYEASYFSS